jgi:hypothetical protein
VDKKNIVQNTANSDKKRRRDEREREKVGEKFEY